MKLALILYSISFCLIIAFWQFLRKPDDLINDCSDSRLAFNQVPSSSWFAWTDKYYPEICRTPNNTTKRKQHGYFLHITDMHVRKKGVPFMRGANIFHFFLYYRLMKTMLKELQ